MERARPKPTVVEVEVAEEIKAQHLLLQVEVPVLTDKQTAALASLLLDTQSKG